MDFAVLLVASLMQPVAEPARLTAADQGKTIETKVGAVLLLILPANGGTGYVWRQEPPVSGSVTVAAEPETAKPSKPGEPKDQAFRLQARSAGQAVMKFALRRPWEKTAKPAGEFRVTLLIRP